MLSKSYAQVPYAIERNRLEFSLTAPQRRTPRPPLARALLQTSLSLVGPSPQADVGQDQRTGRRLRRFGAGTEVVEARAAGQHMREHRDKGRHETYRTRVGFMHYSQKHVRDSLQQVRLSLFVLAVSALLKIISIAQ